MPSYTRKIAVTGKSSQELYDKVSKEIDKFLEKAAVGAYEIERDDSGKQVHLKMKMATATLKCEEGGLTLDAKLSLLAMPFRSKLDEGIDRWIAKTFKA